MKVIFYLLVYSCIFFISCDPSGKEEEISSLKKEISSLKKENSSFPEKIRESMGLSDIIVTLHTSKLTYKNIVSVIVSHPQVKACAPHLNGLVLIGTGSHYAGAVVTGIDYEQECRVVKLKEYIIDANSQNPLNSPQDVPPILIGYELKRELNIKNGDEIVLVTGKRDPQDRMIQPSSRKFVVVGVFRSGWRDRDTRLCYTRRQDLKNFLEWSSDVKEVCIAVKDPKLIDKVTEELKQILKDKFPAGYFTVESWRDRNPIFIKASAK